MLVDFQIDFSKIDESVLTSHRAAEVWRPEDIQFLRNPKAIAKVKRRLNANPLPMSVLIQPRNKGGHKSKDDRCSPDFVTIKLYNNLSTRWMPLTAWMILHRTGHNLQTHAALPEIREIAWHYFPKLFKVIGDEFCSLPREFQAFDPNPYKGLSPCNDAGLTAYYFMTTRSTKYGPLTNELDLFSEAFAQYVTTGKFCLNRLTDPKVAGLLRDKTVEEFNQLLDCLEDEANGILGRVCEEIKGHVLSF